MADKYAVIGNPVGHSKSPLIHAEFARQTDQNISYETVLAPLDGFNETVKRLVAEGYKGANVTVPFKFEAYDFATHLEASAIDAGAVNTLSFTDNDVIGSNTDGLGLVADIQRNLHVQIKGKRVLLIGAGGAAEGVLHPLLEAGPKLVITNRTLEKAIAMTKKIKLHDKYPVTSLSWETFKKLDGQAFDIVINATSTGLSDIPLPIPDCIFAKGCLAYEMMYGRETPFMKQARAADATVTDGFGMLVAQAAEAFYIWHGVKPNIELTMQKLRSL